MARMSELGKAIKFPEGVKVELKGNVSLQKVQAIVEECASGQCLCCGAEFMKEVSYLKVEGEDGNVAIYIKGNNMTVPQVEQNMSQCDKELSLV